MAQTYDSTLLRRLCEQASKETDSHKLMELIRQISEILDKPPCATLPENKTGKTA